MMQFNQSKVRFGIVNLLFTLTFLVAGHDAVYGQDDRVIVEREGQNFFVHKVESGHTLYSISKLYQTTAEAIELANPGVSAGVQLGQTLYIPAPPGYKANMWTNPVRIENGIMIHRVMKKETLYGICRDYTVDVNRMLEFNPAAEKGIQIGMELRIPPNDLFEAPTVIAPPKNEPEVTMPTVPGEPKTTEEVRNTEKGFMHVVEQGETIYGICRRFGISQDELLNSNNGLPAGLRSGDELWIPRAKDQLSSALGGGSGIPGKANTGSPSLDPAFAKDAYNVVVMLPFATATLQQEPSDVPAATRRLQEIAMDIYHGILLSIDSLEAQGARMNIALLEVNAETDIAVVLDHPSVKQAHLIIGPLQRKQLEKVSEYASRKGVHVVCPVPQSNKVLLASPNLSKAQASQDSQIEAIAHRVFQAHRGDNIILINSKQINDVRMVQTFKKAYLNRLRAQGDTTITGITEIEGSSRFVGELQPKLSKSRRNVIIVPAGDESKSMIANLQTKIQLLSKDYAIVLYAPADWDEYEFLDVSFKDRVHLTLPATSYIDYTREDVKTFVRAYRERFGHEPSAYGFVGHDLMQFYGMGLLRFGTNFAAHFNQIPDDGLLHMKFKYRKTGLDSGYENEHVFLLQHNAMQLQPLFHGK